MEVGNDEQDIISGDYIVANWEGGSISFNAPRVADVRDSVTGQ